MEWMLMKKSGERLSGTLIKDFPEERISLFAKIEQTRTQ